MDLFTCMVRAWEGFQYKDKWQELQQRAMSQDFSWVQSALEYIKMYKEMSGRSIELTEDEQSKLNNLIDLRLKPEASITSTSV